MGLEMERLAATWLGSQLAMKSLKEARYRLNLSEGYLKEAEQLSNNQLWRASVSSAQLAVENAAKAVLALFRPVVKTHDLGGLLLNLIEEEEIEAGRAAEVERLAICVSRLGFREHVLTDYGDELTFTLPWELYTKERSDNALVVARDAVTIAQKLVSQNQKRATT